MHIAVIGLGNFGINLARRLAEMGHNISVIDFNPKALARVQDVVEQAVVADATERSVLEELGIDLVDIAVVSLGDNLGSSILVTLHLKEMKIQRIVAKAVSREHEKILKRIGANEVVFPERDLALRLADTLVHSNLLDYLPIGQEYSVAEISPPLAFIGKTLVELDLRRKYNVNVIAIRELFPEKLSLLIEPVYMIKESDILIILGKHENIEWLNKAR